ncbi:hypothetical protein MFLO_05605 [Listeria floridensis FSL S10-1187]|uniref:Coenzyme PQQ synthesis protein D (PqqD) n=1 Tax=Listeria floridensis FSL S10-1187 TaxID=1265817 RepID=A0ABN0RGW1_9LIST|nr:PqqD family protein [Listeria floridensis]EUJ33046.1 hypothetical protein MFLO_05605 [Listeria floridensis FSL S10-1187]
MAKKKVNLLDQVPVLKTKLQVIDEGKKSFLLVERNNPVEKMAIRFFKQQKYRKINLDAEGAFILKRLDGIKDVSELEQEFSQEFGNEDEMSLARLVRFLQIVDSYGWLRWEKKA